MLKENIDVYYTGSVTDYFKKNYPIAHRILSFFSLASAQFLEDTCYALLQGQQITVHAFPGYQVNNGPFIHPRFIRITKLPYDAYFMARESTMKLSDGCSTTIPELISYYYEVAELAWLTTEIEVGRANAHKIGAAHGRKTRSDPETIAEQK
jgi:hypothetical protein